MSEPRLGSRVRAWAWPAVLFVLMALTSLALAITVSVWLVPPYFILMVWILAPAQGSRDSAPAPLAPGSQQDSDAESVSLCEPAELEIGLRSQAEPAVIASSPSETAANPDEGNVPLPVAVKTKRGKGRGRKAKGAPVVEPAAPTATWIQVGPGKFVRVETPSENAPTEPVLASEVSESESTPPPSPALPASEAVEELVPQELAAEVHPEPEGRPAIIDEPAVCDELAEEEPITDDVLSSPDAEASLRPSEEEAVLPEEELAPAEFAVEVSSEREESSTILDEPVAGDELPQEEPITDDVPSSPDAEALLGPSPEEDGVLEEELVPEDRAVEHRWESEDRSAILDDPAACGEFYAEEPITDDGPPSPDAEAWLRPSEEEAALWEEELAPAEFAVEASPEREDASAILEEPAVDDEDAQEEPITDDAPTSPDAEASLWPTPEEVLESAFEGSPGDVAEVAVPRELAVEARSELEDCSAIFEEPAADDESIQDEWVAVTDCAEASHDVEACPQPLAEQGVGPVPDHYSPDFELHHDEPYVDEGACQDASTAHESAVADVESEEGSGACGEVAAESVPEASRLEDHELGPVESSGDQGIALDALDVGWTTELADPPFEEAGSVPSPSLRAVTVSPRSTGSVPFVSWRGVWPRVGPAAGRSSGPRPSRRVVRSGPTVRVSPGFRRRTRRGVGSYRLVCRTFPPRSPPARGTLHRLETGRGVRERG